MSVVALLGSGRSDGDATRLLDAVCRDLAARRVDLGALDIADYAYGGAPPDDFRSVVDALLESDAVLLVTPVYWYAMSGVMKRFVDRLTDLVTVEKARGRALAGRGLWVAACGTEPVAPEGFEVPFRRTAEYFGMMYGGLLYAPVRAGELGIEASTAVAFGGAVGAFRAA